MNTQDVKKLLCSYRGELIDCCLYFYNSVKEESYEQQVECFQVLCEEYGSVKSNETVILESAISKNELDILTDQYGEYVNQVLNSLLKNLTAKDIVADNFIIICGRHSLTEGLLH